MNSMELIREDPERFANNIRRRGVTVDIKRIIALDGTIRADKQKLERLQAERNKISREIADLTRQGDEESVAQAKAKVAQIAETITSYQTSADTTRTQLRDLLSALPNWIAQGVPEGADEKANQEIMCHGNSRDFSAPHDIIGKGFAPRDHSVIGPPLGLDFESATAMSGARFALLRGKMAQLHRALGQYMLDHNIAQGFEECAPPLLVSNEALFGTGQLPKFSADCFQTTDGRWLIPTAEVSLTNIVRDKILDERDLPIRLTALTPCFRSEAGAAGKDTKGLIRQHQFDKVELVTICQSPEPGEEDRPFAERKEAGRLSEREKHHEDMTATAETILKNLELPYRKMLLCAGDMGTSARKTYDLEVWLPGQNLYREISSISDCGRWQARRMNARYRPHPRDGKKQAPRFVNTLNGSALAVGRTLVAVLENYQQEDGSVTIPETLHSYMGGIKRLTPQN